MKIAKLMFLCLLSITLLCSCTPEPKTHEEKIKELYSTFSDIKGFSLTADIDGGERGDFLVKMTYECENFSKVEVMSPDFMRGFTLTLFADKMVLGSDGSCYELKKEMASSPASMALIMSPVLYDLIKTGSIDFSDDGGTFILSGNYAVDKLEVSLRAVFDADLMVPASITVTAGALKITAEISDFTILT